MAARQLRVRTCGYDGTRHVLDLGKLALRGTVLSYETRRDALEQLRCDGPLNHVAGHNEEPDPLLLQIALSQSEHPLSFVFRLSDGVVCGQLVDKSIQMRPMTSNEYDVGATL
jgi:hypothetical protein